MNAGRLIQAIWGECNNREEEDAKEVMIAILRDKDYFVAGGERELREVALANTTLVEPE